MSNFFNETFLYPLGLLGLLAIPIIVIIYILRSKYKTKNVSSTFIWKRSLKYVKRRIPLNFIMSLLLILQILTVIAASLAIARPTIKPLKSEEKIIILDASASMLITDGTSTRFDYAVEKIKEEAENIGPNNKITVILAGEEATVLGKEGGRIEDKGELLTAISGIKCTSGNADIEKALVKAGDILNQNAGAKIFLYTDKEYITHNNVEIVDCKRDGEWNAGIISFEDNSLITGVEFVANVGNYGVKSKCNIKLMIDGNVLAQTTLDFEKNQTRQIRFTHSTTADTGVDETKVLLRGLNGENIKTYEKATILINTEDSFGYDNEFTIYPKEKETPDILYVSKYVVNENGNVSCPGSHLYVAMMAAGYSIDSRNMYSSIDEIKDENFKGYDLYIFEGVKVYDYLPTDGAVWLLNCDGLPASVIGLDPVTGVQSGINYNETVYNSGTNLTGYEFEQSLSTDVVAEIVKNVNFSIPMNFGTLKIPAAVTEYRPIEGVGTNFKPLYTANGHNVMVAGNVGSIRVVVSSFDFGNSSLGAFVSDFPLLMYNMVGYSTPDPLPERTASIGETVNFYYPVGATTVVQKYNGAVVNKVDVASSTALMESVTINEPGKYEWVVTLPTGKNDPNNPDKELTVEKTYAVTGHMSVDESIGPFKEDTPSGILIAPTPADGTVEQPERVEILPYIIAALIFLLIVEWGVYYRDQY